MSMLLTHQLRCKMSGLTIGKLEVTTTAGTLPYLSHWDKCVVMHPVFSMDTQKLLRFARSEWDRVIARPDEEGVTQAEQEVICVTYLAMLHTLNCIKQDCPALPPFYVVQATISRLFALAFWKWKLESERFRFPTLHISKFNQNDNFTNIGDYLDLCFDIRKDYETKRHEAAEAEKVRAAEKALIALNNTWVTPPGKKVLWQWVKAHLPEKYHPDAEGWLSTLFLGGSGAIVEFDKEDIQMARDIIESSCPAGTGILFAVRNRLDLIEATWKNYHNTFEIELSDFADNANVLVNGAPVLQPHPGPAPVAKDFPKLALYLVADAKWKIAMAAWKKQQL